MIPRHFAARAKCSLAAANGVIGYGQAGAGGRVVLHILPKVTLLHFFAEGDTNSRG